MKRVGQHSEEMLFIGDVLLLFPSFVLPRSRIGKEMLDMLLFSTHLLRRQRVAIHFDGAPQITLFRFHYFEELSLVMTRW